MSLSMAEKLNLVLIQYAMKIVQRDRPNVKVLGEVKDFLIRISPNLKLFQIIDITITNIPYSYGLFLNKYWSEKLSGYFSSDWSHLWFPLNGKTNTIKV